MGAVSSGGSGDEDERLVLAYQAAVSALVQQDTNLGNLRNRATGILSTSALLTSLVSGLRLFGTETSTRLPTWDAFTLLIILIAIGTLSMLILWPATNWCFGPATEVILEKVDDGEDVNDVRRFMAEALTVERNLNDKKLTIRQSCYRWAVGLLVVQVIVLVAGLAW